MPSGTSCSLSAADNSFCILGKCLRFGNDKTPTYDLSEEIMTDIKRIMIQPRSLRFKRELHIEPPLRVAIDQSYLEQLVERVNATHFNDDTDDTDASVSEIAFDNPVDLMNDNMPYTEFYSNASSLKLNSSSIFITIVVLMLCR